MIRRPTLGRAAAVACLVAIVMTLGAPAALAHPLGNFTTNTSATILPTEGQTQVLYVLDLAEIPTQQTRSTIDSAGGPESWAADECGRIAEAQQLTVEQEPRPLQATGAAISFPEGQAGLQTLRLSCSLDASTEGLPNPATLSYVDTFTADRIGWREIIAASNDSTILEADVPASSSTDQLRVYETTEISTVTTAQVTFDPTGGPPPPDSLQVTGLAPVRAAPGGLKGLVERYTTLVSRQTLTPAFVLLAFVLAIGLGTAHAVAPGHGKTVIAAYLLGEGGKANQAVALGGTVAVTHTIGVLVLGLIVQTSTTLAPESLYPILGVMGGAIFAGLGCVLLYRALANRGHIHDHDHDHAHTHDHDQMLVAAGVAKDDPVGAAGIALADDHAHPRHSHGHSSSNRTPPEQQTTWRMLILPGLAGGMVPSPSALLVLLGGIALGRTWFGVLLVVAYGIGMALALVGAGYLLHRVRFRVMDRLEGNTWARVSTALPIITSSLIIVGGLVIAARSVLIG